MRGMSSIEHQAVERASAEPMLDQVLAWSAINSGSRNLGGLERVATALADAFSPLPGGGGGSSTITIHRTKVSMPIYKHVTIAPPLSHTNHRFVY